MYLPGTEALAGLQLIVAVAKADGPLTEDERTFIAESLEDAELPDGITTGALIGSSYDVDALIAQVVSQEARDVAFAACLTMAHANRVCLPKQQTILDKIESAWAVPEEKKTLLGRVFTEARDTVWLTQLEPTADRVKRAALVKEDILRYSVLSAVLGLNPLPLVSIVTDLAVVGLQAKMFRDIGQYWGRETSGETIQRVITGLGVGTGARVAVNGLMKFVPGVGSVFAASTNFASTWALGQVADQYWASGGKTDLDMADIKQLRESFEKSKAEGKRLYEDHKADVEAKHVAHVALLEELAVEFKAGRITLADYERQIVELK
jgi:uncharacterized protein (DUF697 family)